MSSEQTTAATLRRSINTILGLLAVVLALGVLFNSDNASHRSLLNFDLVIDPKTVLYKSDVPLQWPGPMDHLVDRKNRLVVLIVSCAYLDFMDNSIVSMREAHVRNFVIVPLDQAAYDFASRMYPRNVVPVPPTVHDVDSTQIYGFGSDEFKQLTSSRPTIIRKFLELGHEIFYVDTDVVWRENIFKEFEKEQSHGYDLIAMNDRDIENGHAVCTGYLYFQPTERSMHFLIEWERLIATGRYHEDQQAGNVALEQVGDGIKTLLYPHDNPIFPNGQVYFEFMSEEEKNKVFMIHNNFIRGNPWKKNRLIDNDLWHLSGRLDMVGWTEEACMQQN